MKKFFVLISAFSLLFALDGVPQNYRTSDTVANIAHCKRKKPSGFANQKRDVSMELNYREFS